MADPQKYQRTFSFTGYQETSPAAPLPGPRVDDELENIEAALNGTVDAVKDIRRSDGRLKNGIVTADSLAPNLTLGFGLKGLWEPGVLYDAGDGVLYDQVFYSARFQHLSSNANRPDLDPNTWNLLFSVVDIVVTGALSMPVFTATADGVSKTYNLGFIPVSGSNVIASFNGVLQRVARYSVNGTSITFLDTPPVGAAIEVRGIATTATAVTVPDGAVTFAKLDPGVANAITTAQTTANTGVANAGAADAKAQNALDKANATLAFLPTVAAGDAGKVPVVRSDLSGLNLEFRPTFDDVWDTTSPIAISMHFGTLCGTGFGLTDPTGVVASNTTAAVANGATAIPVVNGALFKVNQLINYQAIDTYYYSTVVRSISGNTLNITKPVRGGIASGSPVRNFYNDTTPHPNEFGYYTLVDDALRQIQYKTELVYRSVDSRDWKPANGGVLTTDVTPAYGNPGSSDAFMSGVSVAVSANNDGARSRSVELEGGLYVTRIPFNGGTTSGMAVELGLTLANGTQAAVGFYGAGTTPGSIEEAEFIYRAPPGARVWAFAHATAAGAASFSLGQITHRKVTQRFAAPDRGKHILFGDSWFAQGHFFNRLKARLPHADIINKGVFGNSAADLLARISADVLSLSPDFVWLMCGTNDYNNGLSAAYQETMNKIIIQLVAAGIQVFLFDPSVGTSLNLDASRKLTLGTTLEDGTGLTPKRHTFMCGPQNLAAGGSFVVGSLPAKMIRPARIRFAGVSGSIAQSVRFFYGSSVNDVSGSPAFAMDGGVTYTDVIIPKTDRNESWLTAMCFGASAGLVGFTAEVEYFPAATN